MYALPFGECIFICKIAIYCASYFRAYIIIYNYSLVLSLFMEWKICACIVAKNLHGIVCTAKPIQQSFNFKKFAKKLNNILDKGQI